MRLFIVLTILLAQFSSAVTIQNAESAYNTLQTWYNSSNGLWIPSTGWWNSANCLTVIADLASINPSMNVESASIFSETFTKAQQYNLQMTKTLDARYLMWSWYSDARPYLKPGQSTPAAASTNGFLNGYYDDEGWWALAWIAAYDVTQDAQYLSTAEGIFEDMYAAYNTTPCGGIWWDKAHTYVNAIANELFLSTASHLANRASDKKNYYTSIAEEQWRWFEASGMINSGNTINDGLDNKTCSNNGQTVWSYNQGVILGALVELNRASLDGSYLTKAKAIADAAILALSDSNGILHDPCEPNCGGDGSQFKGVFTRNLALLNQASPEPMYSTFLQRNADSVWNSDKGRNDELGLVWSGPVSAGGPANASTQSSAMDVIIAALAAG